jgi:hypothetical protein
MNTFPCPSGDPGKRVSFSGFLGVHLSLVNVVNCNSGSRKWWCYTNLIHKLVHKKCLDVCIWMYLLTLSPRRDSVSFSDKKAVGLVLFCIIGSLLVHTFMSSKNRDKGVETWINGDCSFSYWEINCHFLNSVKSSWCFISIMLQYLIES